MRLFKKKEKEVEIIKLHKYYDCDLEEIDYEEYYNDWYGESWL